MLRLLVLLAFTVFFSLPLGAVSSPHSFSEWLVARGRDCVGDCRRSHTDCRAICDADYKHDHDFGKLHDCRNRCDTTLKVCIAACGH